MRPPLFSGGNYLFVGRIRDGAHVASMRPPLFSGGNRHETYHADPFSSRFNEAAAFQRRKSGARQQSALEW